MILLKKSTSITTTNTWDLGNIYAHIKLDKGHLLLVYTIFNISTRTNRPKNYENTPSLPLFSLYI